MSDELLDRLRDGVLLKHRFGATTGRAIACSCDQSWRDDAQHRQHLAQAIIDSGIVADLWDEGYEAAAKYHELDTESSEPNPYRIEEEA